MRKVDAKNQIWYLQNGEVVQLGFTKSFIDSLDQCWHILPANTEQVKKKSPLFVVETSDAMISIMSPLEGYVRMYNEVAHDFPDQLTENTVIMELVSAEPVRAVNMRGADAVPLPPANWDFGDVAAQPVLAEGDILRQVRERMLAQAGRPVVQPRAPRF